MKLFIRLLAPVILIVGSLSSSAIAAPLVIDDFNSYVSGSYIQNQPDMNWSRFGTATSDGIYSVADGVDGTRAGRYQVSYNAAANVNGSVRYTFTEHQDFTLYPVFTLDIAVNQILPSTQVFAQIADGDGAERTVLETLTPLPIDSLGFKTYEFIFSADTVRRVEGSASFSDVLGNLKSVTFRFWNPDDIGNQSLTIDNLTAVQAIPEPAMSVLYVLILCTGLWMYRKRR